MPSTFAEFLNEYTGFIKNAKQIKLDWTQIEMVNRTVRDHFDFDERTNVYDVINKHLLSEQVTNGPYARTLTQNRQPTKGEMRKLRGDIFYEVMSKITAMKMERDNLSPLDVSTELSEKQFDGLLVRNGDDGDCDNCGSAIGRFRANLVCGHSLDQVCLEKLVRKTAKCPICERVV